MPTVKLTPSTYYLSSTQYLTVSNASNMYADCDSTTYATIQNTRTSTTSYYAYIRGFDFSQIPSTAVVSSVAVRIKGYYSGGYSQNMYLYDGTTAMSGSASSFGTSVATHEFSSLPTWAEMVGAGSDFGIRINCRRSNRNTVAYFYIYGAEIEVTYTVPVSATVTSTLTGNGTISPSGATSTYEGSEYTLTITPTTASDTVTVTNNGVDVSSQLVAHYAGGTATSDLGTYSLVSGGFNGSGATYFEGIVGNGANATQTTSNYYSSGSGTQAVFRYQMPVTVPSGATVTRVWVEVNGHAESTSNASEYMCAQLFASDGTALTSQLNFKDVGTSNSTQTLEATTLPTQAQCSGMYLECVLGYYGGAINGATVHVAYEIPSAYPEYWTYTFTVSGNATIAVTIGGSAAPTFYVRVGGSWVAVNKVYRKANGAWAEVNPSTLDASANYVRA